MVQQLVHSIPYVDVNYKALPFQFYNNRYLPKAENLNEKEITEETNQDANAERYEDERHEV